MYSTGIFIMGLQENKTIPSNLIPTTCDNHQAGSKRNKSKDKGTFVDHIHLHTIFNTFILRKIQLQKRYKDMLSILRFLATITWSRDCTQLFTLFTQLATVANNINVWSALNTQQFQHISDGVILIVVKNKKNLYAQNKYKLKWKTTNSRKSEWEVLSTYHPLQSLTTFFGLIQMP